MVNMHIYGKEILRLIRQAKGRFVILTLIVWIGSAFFTGVGSSGSLMAANVDRYTDETKLKDITLYSSVGFDETDVKNVQALDAVVEAEGERFVDVNGMYRGDLRTVRVQQLPEGGSLNQFVLKQGRLPQKKDEVLGEAGTLSQAGYALGAKVTLSRPDDDLSDFLQVDTVTIVGTVDSPLYLNAFKETSALHGRQIDTFFFAMEDAFSFSYFTAIDVAVKGARVQDTFAEDYFQNITAAQNEIEAFAEKTGGHRLQTIVAEAEKKLREGKQEYQDAVEDFERKIKAAEEELADSRRQLAEGRRALQEGAAEIADHQRQLEQAQIDGEREIEDARAKIAAARKELEQKQAEYDAAAAAGQTAVQALQTTAASLQAPLEQLQRMENLQTQLAPLPDTMPMTALTDPDLLQTAAMLEAQIQVFNPAFVIATIGDFKNAALLIVQNIQTQLSAQLTPHADEFAKLDIHLPTAAFAYTASAVENLQAEMNAKQALIQKQLNDGESALRQGRAELDRAYAMTVHGATVLYQRLEEGQKQLADARVQLAEKSAEIKDGAHKLAEGEEELRTRKADGEKRLADAREDLEDAQKALHDLSARWTILNRRQLYGVETYRNSVLQMQSIASVFPAFFVLVAALVCTTTMTRMIDEQRGQMGVLRALGFSRAKCAALYAVYALAAGILGAVCGSVVGMLTLPQIIYRAWGMMYALPPFHLQIPWTHCLLSVLFFPGTLLVTTLFVTYKELRTVPAALLRPKTGGGHPLFPGKRKLWRRIRFIHKVTIRNLFRYKKRFILTVIGVAGCTALLVTGFGIRRSIAAMVDLQYRDLSHYDVMLFPTHTSDFKSLETEMTKADEQSWCMRVSTFSIKLKNTVDTLSTKALVFNTAADQEQAFTMRTRLRHTKMTVADTGIYISEKTAENLQVKIGDTVRFQNADGTERSVSIAGIYESYLEHPVILSKAAYQSVFQEMPKDNCLLLHQAPERLASLRRQLENDGRIREMTFAADTADRYESMLGSLGLIVGVIVLCSMALTFVVVGNLTMINIAERTREIATLKVLGFRKAETRRFIALENTVLVVLGALCGLWPGVGLHHWIMRQVEMETVMFYRSIAGFDLLIAFVLTVFFGALVNRMLRRQLDSIQMVESLKSVE